MHTSLTWSGSTAKGSVILTSIPDMERRRASLERNLQSSGEAPTAAKSKEFRITETNDFFNYS